MRISFLIVCIVLIMSGFAFVQQPLSFRVAADARPNIVFILADDLGYGDLGCYGNPYNRTPHIDTLARRGLRFTQAYSASPVCSPSRAAILTGKHPARLHLTNFLVGERIDSTSNLLPANWTRYLPASEETLAERLRRHGYRTGMVGKWHLGSAGPTPGNPASGDSLTPTGQGFDYERQISENGLDYYNYGISSAGKRVFRDSGRVYLTDKLTDYALEFLNQPRPAQQPFFLYMCYSAPHVLLVPRADKVRHYLYKYERFGGKFNPYYGAMIESMDDGVGRLMAWLRQRGLLENTIVVFKSDNGGLIIDELGPVPTTNAPLRAGKGHVYEGGIRVPLIMAGPGIAVGKTCPQPVMDTDFVPTFLELTHSPDRPAVADGRSMVALLRNPAALVEPRPLFWHYPHFSNQRSRPSGAVRVGNYKLVEHFEKNRTELYDLATDPAEQRDLTPQQPQRAQAMLATLRQWRQSVKANMPRQR